MLAGVPLAALAAGTSEAAASARLVQVQAAWRSTPAILLRNAPPRAHALGQAALDPLVPARWTASGGVGRTGDVYAPGGARAGTTVRVRTDRAGRLVGEPLRRSDVAGRAALAGLLAATITVVVLLACLLLFRRVLDARRLAAWDVGWARTEPQWTGRR